MSDRERTGWPPGLLQDDSTQLSRWLANRPGARRQAKEAAAELICGRVSNGYVCDMPKGHKCPDCGLALHDFPEGS